MTAREQFCKKIYEEYAGFQKQMLCKSKSAIYGEAYRIDIFVNLYEMLLQEAERLPDTILRFLLQQSGILEMLYERWLKKADSSYEELMCHVREEVMKSTEKSKDGEAVCKFGTDTFAQSR